MQMVIKSVDALQACPSSDPLASLVRCVAVANTLIKWKQDTNLINKAISNVTEQLAIYEQEIIKVKKRI